MFLKPRKWNTKKETEATENVAFVLPLHALIRHVGYLDQQKLERIYSNALPEYLWYIRRKHFWNLAELLEMVDDLESIPVGNELGE